MPPEQYHILNGDVLASQISDANIPGEAIVCREAMIEGPLHDRVDEAFWDARSNYIADTYHETPEGYRQKVLSQFDAIKALPTDAEVNLWFEDDLFCQANLWLILYLLHQKQHRGHLYRVFPVIPKGQNRWNGFGLSDSDMLRLALSQRIPLTQNDLELGSNLWQAYANQDFTMLAKLSQTVTKAFVSLPEVVQAHIERFPVNGALGRPERAIKEILAQGATTFKEVFLAFIKREGIYGFGDLQVKRMYDVVK